MDPLTANIASNPYIIGIEPPDTPTPPSPPPSPSSTTPGGLYFLFAGLILALILGATCLLLSCWKYWLVKRREQAGSMTYNAGQASFQSRSSPSGPHTFPYNSSTRRPLSPYTRRPPLLRTHSTSPTQSDDKLNESDGTKGSVRQYQQFVVVVQPSGEAGAIGWYEEEEEEAPQLERKESSEEEEEGIDSKAP